MDNFFIDITGEGSASLAKALEIAFEHNAPGDKATHYKTVRLLRKTTYRAATAAEHCPENLDRCPGLHVYHWHDLVEDKAGHLTLVLLWHTSGKGESELPYPLKIEDAVPFVKGWLDNAGDAGKQPDIDGDLGKGWRVFTGAWGRVAGCSRAIVGVQACWAMYGK